AEWQRPDEVVELLTIPAGGHVVDIGAGTGYFLPYLSVAVGADGRVEGLDVSTPMVEYMQQRIETEGLGNASARVVPGDDPELTEASIDRVLIVNTWHHIPERIAYAEKLRAG